MKVALLRIASCGQQRCYTSIGEHAVPRETFSVSLPSCRESHGHQEHSNLITLTDYLNYRTCAGYAWLVKFKPRVVPSVSDPTSRRRQLADADVRQMFAERYLVDVAMSAAEPETAAIETLAAMAAGASAIGGATVVTARGVVGRADFLIATDDGWDVILTHASTSVKSDHAIEAAYLAQAFIESGIQIRQVRFGYLNKSYRRGSALDLDQLLVEVDFGTRLAGVAARVADEISAALAALGDPTSPAACLCHKGTRNMRCPTFAQFHPKIGKRNTVYDLAGISARKLKTVLARGITQLVDWPEDIEVNARQRLQIEVLRSGLEQVDPGAISSFLERLEYPLHFLDYETFQLAVPRFERCLPWSQVPFQYSVHVVHEDGSREHREFLATTPDVLPVTDLVARLRQDIGIRGSVVVWNQGFEQSRNRDMAEMLPGDAPFLNDVSARMIDLMDLVQHGAWAHPAFGGSASIKKVLPVAAPLLSYDHLEIGEGMVAAEQWVSAVMREPGNMNDNERSAVFAALREYCQRDTLAMVLVLGHVRQLMVGMEVSGAVAAE